MHAPSGKVLSSVPGMRDAAQVPCEDARTLSETVFTRDYVAHSKPCLVRGAVNHWPALEKWRDKEYLKRQAGHHSVHLYLSEYHVTTRRLLHNQRAVTFAEAVGQLHSEQTERGIVPIETLKEFLSDLGGLSFLKKADPGFFYVPARYFFYRNAGTAWHYHPFDETLTCQIVGRKQIGLVDSRPPFNTALRDIFFAEDYYDDPGVFGALNGSPRWLSATLEEGDALYIPPLWWHGIAPLTATFGATAAVTWRSPPQVVAEGIGRMARGEVDLLGRQNAAHFPALVALAHKLGLEKELALACQRVG